MKVQYIGLSFGADPEFFFKKDGDVIGAEKVITPQTERYYIGEDSHFNSIYGTRPAKNPTLIIDGVQAEFNVVPNSCRQSFSTNLAVCFQKAAEQIKGKGITASFAQTVSVEKDEMESLSETAQQFGCAPSKNAYGETKIAIKDASKYYKRSAGGHIHLGGVAEVLKPEAVVPVLDIVLGNTCVLIDRDPGNIERRKVYGRAGEYRMPKHGLEYRVLSNFWLRSYQTMSFVLGMARFAVSIANNPEARAMLISLVDMQDIQDAINNNDAELAQANFDKVKEFLASIQIEGYSDADNAQFGFPIKGERLEQFEFFVSKGLDYWFKEDIMKHWVTHNYRERDGWENFLNLVVAKKMPVKTTLKEKVAEKGRTLIASFGNN